jgi:hypothetical protein
MRETVQVRPAYWLILLGMCAYGAIYTGFIDVRGIARWLSSQPDVAQAFSDPNFGRADALILVFSTLFLGPLAMLLAFLMLIFVVAVFGGFLLPVMRWFRLPDWVATGIVLVTVVALLWVHSNLWLPHSLRLMGLFARACLIVISA